MKSEISYLKKLRNPEVTTSMLIGVLSDYEDTRGKISSLSRKGTLKPIKQGVYLVNEDLGFRPHSKEILANLIYGPSYISLETALSGYGFIPERVNVTTSICLGRGKSFSTPVGEFEYHHVKESIYAMGVQMKEVFKGAFCQYAAPEKALLDFLYIKETKGDFKNSKDYFKYLLDSYRFDLQTIESEISLKKLQNMAERFPFQQIQWFSTELTRKLLK
ncbi:MAG: hypothetical protein JNM39_05365 [Bdellovibrionaceae bacterium]|nr:hypothetical protein [Pseudobdellovibrionaceae bacterium]